jgi:Putative restriction endonuclease
MGSMLADLNQPGMRWPPDDTEESVVGTDWHQTTIMNLRWGINEIARAEAHPDEPLPWQASGQIMITGFLRHDGSRYTVLPDVFVYDKPFERARQSLSLRRNGVPTLIVEVASESTCDADLDLATGKGWTYARAGVKEYLVLDPSGLYMDVPLCAWRLVGGEYQEVTPDAEGIWWSEELPLGIGFPDGQAAVYDRAHRRQLREGEISGYVAELRRRIDELEHQ